MLVNIFVCFSALLCAATVAVAAPPEAAAAAAAYASVNVTGSSAVPESRPSVVVRHRAHQAPLRDIVRISSVLSPAVSSTTAAANNTSHSAVASEPKLNNTQVVKIRQFKRRHPRNQFNAEDTKDKVRVVVKGRPADGWEKAFANKIGLAPPALESFRDEDKKSLLDETQIEAVYRPAESTSSTPSPLATVSNSDLRSPHRQAPGEQRPTILSDNDYAFPPLTSALPMEHFQSPPPPPPPPKTFLENNSKLAAFIEYQNAQQQQPQQGESGKLDGDGVSDEDILRRFRYGQDYTLKRLPKTFNLNGFNDRAIYGPDLGAPTYSDQRKSDSEASVDIEENADDDNVAKLMSSLASKHEHEQDGSTEREKVIVTDHHKPNYQFDDYLREQLPDESVRSNAMPEVYEHRQSAPIAKVDDHNYPSSSPPQVYHDGYSVGYQGRMWRDFPSFSSVPKTSFVCPGYGFFADIETGCQAWHYCQPDGRHDSFLCGNGTLFNQATRVCDWWHRVDCYGTRVANNVDMNHLTAHYNNDIDHYQRLPEAASGVHHRVITPTNAVPVRYTRPIPFTATKAVPLVNYAGETDERDDPETLDNAKGLDDVGGAGGGGQLYKIFDLKRKRK